MVSMPPPGAKPTMKVSLRLGKFCAAPKVDAMMPRASIATSAISAPRSRTIRMVPPQPNGGCLFAGTVAARGAQIECSCGRSAPLEFRHRGDHPLDVLRPRQAVIAVLDQREHHVVPREPRRQLDRMLPRHVRVL